MKTLEILLSVYGKADFLGELLQSLKHQDCRTFRLLYRFDGEASPDAEKLLTGFPESMEISGREHLGVVHSYRKLMQNSTADFLMFADQDDIWHPDKVSESLKAVEKLEREAGKNTPVLVHTDLQVVDSSGQLISPSLWKLQALNPQKNSLKDLMIQNNVTGCTVILNRALAELICTFPDAAICHDWYLAMTAAAFGKVSVLNRGTVDYRQHHNNVYGAVPRRSLMAKLWKRKQLHERIVLTQKQAKAFLNQFREKLSPEQVKILDVWGNELPRTGYWKRLLTVWKYRFRKNDALRTLGLWWAL